MEVLTALWVVLVKSGTTRGFSECNRLTAAEAIRVDGNVVSSPLKTVYAGQEVQVGKHISFTWLGTEDRLFPPV